MLLSQCVQGLCHRFCPFSTLFLCILSLFGVQEVKEDIAKLQGPVEAALSRREEVMSEARPLEGQRIQETATVLSTNWDKLNKLYQDRLKLGWRYIKHIQCVRV